MPFVDQFPVDLPSSSDPANFDPRADAYYGHLPTFVAQLNALASLLASAAAPPFSIPYQFSATTTVADPGAGKIRLDNAVQTSATALLADLVNGIGQTVTGVLDQIATSTSVIKGYLKLNAVADPTKWIMWPATAVASPTGYKNISLQAGQGVGSSASPFADGDLVTLSFVPKGDKGDVGPNGPWTGVLSSVTPSGQTVLTYSSIPTGYADLLFPIEIVPSAVAQPTLALSADGITYSSFQAINGLQNVALYGWLLIQDYRSNRPVLSAYIKDASVPSSPSVSGPGLATGSVGLGRAEITGGISAVRFGLTNGANFTSSATMPQPRAR